MNSIMFFLQEASSAQLFVLLAALIVWVLGGYFLKKKLIQRLESQSHEPTKNIQIDEVQFEDINNKEWGIFAALSIISIGLVIFAINMPAFNALI